MRTFWNNLHPFTRVMAQFALTMYTVSIGSMFIIHLITGQTMLQVIAGGIR